MAQGKETNTYKIKASDVKNKLKTAQEALEKQKTILNNLKVDYRTAVALYNDFKAKQQKPSPEKAIALRNQIVTATNRKSKISQAVTDRSRTASRAEGIVNRKDKKIK